MTNPSPSPLPEPQAVSDLARRAEEARERLWLWTDHGTATKQERWEQDVAAYRAAVESLTEARCRGEQEQYNTAEARGALLEAMRFFNYSGNHPLADKLSRLECGLNEAARLAAPPTEENA